MATKEKETEGAKDGEGRRAPAQERQRAAARRARRERSRAVRTRAPGCRCRAPRLKAFYHEQRCAAKLTQQFGFKNPHQMPRSRRS